MDFHKLNENKLINIKNCSKDKDIPKNMKDFLICMEVFLTDYCQVFLFCKKKKSFGRGVESIFYIRSRLKVGFWKEF